MTGKPQVRRLRPERRLARWLWLPLLTAGLCGPVAAAGEGVAAPVPRVLAEAPATAAEAPAKAAEAPAKAAEAPAKAAEAPAKAAEAPATAPQPPANLMAKRLQRLYYYVYQGNLADRVANEKLAAKYRQEAAARQRDADESKAKKKAYEDRLELARLYGELSRHNAAIVKALEDSAGDLQGSAAMEAIPKLERQIEAISETKVERDWLTPYEVQARMDSGLKFKTEAADILPYAPHHWFRPGKEHDEKTDAPRKRTPPKELLP